MRNKKNEKKNLRQSNKTAASDRHEQVLFQKKYSRVHADIDLDAFLWNLREIHRIMDEKTKIMAVIKTDAYGHGALELSELMEEIPYVGGYAVASADEGRVLRQNGRKKPILILGYSFPDQYDEIIEYRLIPTIFDLESAIGMAEAAQRADRLVPVHIKLDTGMGRIGYPVTEEAADEIAHIAKEIRHLQVDGIFTHFAKADEEDKAYTRQQTQAFADMIRMLEERDVQIPVRHVSNSAAILDLPEYNMDLVRAGIILYGLHPSEETKNKRLDLKPLLSLKSKVVHVKDLPAGSALSYGGTCVLSKDARIATIPVGYGDGYARTLSGKGWVLIRGKRAPICGRVCMDQFMVDVSKIPDVQVGDEVTLIGRDGCEEITMEMLGELSGRFNYEFACDLGKRVPRNYYSDGVLVKQMDYF